MADDRASQAMSCCGRRINQTPNPDRIAKRGPRFDNCFWTGSICTQGLDIDPAKVVE